MRQAPEQDDSKDKPARLRKEDLPEAISQAVLRSVEGGGGGHSPEIITIGIQFEQTNGGQFFRANQRWPTLVMPAVPRGVVHPRRVNGFEVLGHDRSRGGRPTATSST